MLTCRRPLLQVKDQKIQSHLIAALSSLAAQRQLLSSSQHQMVAALLAEAKEQRAAGSGKKLTAGGGAGSTYSTPPRRSLLGFGRRSVPGSGSSISCPGSPATGGQASGKGGSVLAPPRQSVFDLGDSD